MKQLILICTLLLGLAPSLRAEGEPPRPPKEEPKEAPKLSNGERIEIPDVGFSVTPPNGWMVHKNSHGSSLLFEAPKQANQIYQPTIQVMAFGKLRYIDEVTQKEYGDLIVEKFGKLSNRVTGYRLRSAEILQMETGDPAILYYTEFQYDDVPIMQMHILISSATNHFLMSYTDIAKVFEDESSPGLAIAYASMHSAQVSSQPPWRFRTPAMIGAVALLMLVGWFTMRFMRSRKLARLGQRIEDEDSKEISSDEESQYYSKHAPATHAESHAGDEEWSQPKSQSRAAPKVSHVQSSHFDDDDDEAEVSDVVPISTLEKSLHPGRKRRQEHTQISQRQAPVVPDLQPQSMPPQSQAPTPVQQQYQQPPVQQQQMPPQQQYQQPAVQQQQYQQPPAQPVPPPQQQYQQPVSGQHPMPPPQQQYQQPPMAQPMPPQQQHYQQPVSEQPVSQQQQYQQPVPPPQQQYQQPPMQAQQPVPPPQQPYQQPPVQAQQPVPPPQQQYQQPVVHAQPVPPPQQYQQPISAPPVQPALHQQPPQQQQWAPQPESMPQPVPAHIAMAQAAQLGQHQQSNPGFVPQVAVPQAAPAQAYAPSPAPVGQTYAPPPQPQSVPMPQFVPPIETASEEQPVTSSRQPKSTSTSRMKKNARSEEDEAESPDMTEEARLSEILPKAGTIEKSKPKRKGLFWRKKSDEDDGDDGDASADDSKASWAKDSKRGKSVDDDDQDGGDQWAVEPTKKNAAGRAAVVEDHDDDEEHEGEGDHEADHEVAHQAADAGEADESDTWAPEPTKRSEPKKDSLLNETQGPRRLASRAPEGPVTKEAHKAADAEDGWNLADAAGSQHDDEDEEDAS